jgi:lipopolysaccharide transport system permease protein
VTAKTQPNRHADAVTIIEPGGGWQAIGLKEIWHHRELLRMLTMRDVKVRYKQTILGMGWAVFQPFVAMVVFTVVLNGVAGVQSEPGVPYPVYVYAGLVIWLYFSDAITRASRSLVTNNILVSKVYFPRLIAPLSGIAAPVIDFGLAMTILIILMLWYGVGVSWTLLLVPPLFLATMLCASAFGIWLSALNVEYRDIGYAVPLIVQLGMFLTPVVYSPSSLHGPLRVIYSLNPMAGIVMAFRWAVLARGSVDWGVFAPSMLVLVVILVSGVLFFRRIERNFADAI